MVERVTEQSVESIGIPSVALRADSRGAFGGQEAQALGNTAQALSAFAVQQRQERDNQAVIEADNALSEFEIPYLTDTETGLYTKKGKLAEGVTQQAILDYDKTVRTIEENLSPSQVESFKRLAGRRKESFHKQSARHEFNQFQSYKEENANAMIANSSLMAVNHAGDSEIMDAQLKRIRGAIDSTFQGEGKEARDVRYNAAASNIYQQSTEMMLSQGRNQEASDFFDKYKSEMNPQERTVIQRQLKAQGQLGKAQEKADSIILKADNQSTAIDKAKSISNPEVRQKTITLIDNHYRRQESIKTAAKREAKEQGWQHVESGESVDKMNPKLRAVLEKDGKTIAAMEKRERDMISGVEPVQDWQAWTNLNAGVNRAVQGDAEAIKTIKEMDVYALYRDKLDDQYFAQAVNLQQSFINADARSAAATKNSSIKVVTDGASLKNTAELLFGKKPTGRNNPDQWNQQYNVLYGWFQSEIDAWSAGNPKAKSIPASVRDEILDRALIEATKEDGGFLFFDKDVTIGDIPVDDLEDIQAVLRANNRAVTPENILAVYTAG